MLMFDFSSEKIVLRDVYLFIVNSCEGGFLMETGILSIRNRALGSNSSNYFSSLNRQFYLTLKSVAAKHL